jgi:hypothetical protein
MCLGASSIAERPITEQPGEHACNRTPEKHSLSSTIGSWPRCPSVISDRFCRTATPSSLRRGEVISEPGERIRDVYFPTDSFVSLVTPPADHAGLEVRLVGNEGMIGTPLILGVEVTHIRTFVQGGGPAWRLSSEGFGGCAATERRATGAAPPLSRRVDEPGHAAARLHPFPLGGGTPRPLAVDVPGPGALRPLPCHPRTPGAVVGGASCGRHQGGECAASARADSLSPGDVTVLDRAGLQGAACGCYAAAEALYEQGLG